MTFLSSVLIAGGIVAACCVLEMRFPAEPDPGVASRLEDLLLFMLNSAVVIAVSPLLGMAVGGSLRCTFSKRWMPSGRAIASEKIRATLVYALVWDFFQYWFHRAGHQSPFLWRFHRTHHDGHAMSSSTSLRQSLGANFIGFVCTHLPTVCILGYRGFPTSEGSSCSRPGGTTTTPTSDRDPDLQQRALRPARTPSPSHRRAANVWAQPGGVFPFYDRMFGTYAPPQRHTRLSTFLPARRSRE